jgi:quercetin dioxygenase-like cupin family protein
MTVQGLLGPFTLDEEIARFPAVAPSGRRSEILIKMPDLRVILVTMRSGTELHHHTAPGTITIQPLQGRFALVLDDGERELAPGMLVALEGGTGHAVRATEDGAFLLTIAWSGGAGDRDVHQLFHGSAQG